MHENDNEKMDEDDEDGGEDLDVYDEYGKTPPKTRMCKHRKRRDSKKFINDINEYVNFFQLRILQQSLL